MSAVSDTSPISYLILIGEVEVLDKLFGSVMRQGLIDLPLTIAALQRTSFRAHPALLRGLLS